MGPTDRIIVLIDMDCFYCQVEEKLDINLDGKPIAVVQYNAWRGGGIIAVNYPARDQGVTRHMRGNDAKKKCPSINLVQVPEVRGKADLTKYRDAGKRVADVLATFTPLLERASVDEAYLDITESVKKRIESGLEDLTLENIKNTFVVGCETKDFLQNVTSSQEFQDGSFRLLVGALITEEIRREVCLRTGYKCSAGIAHNKILAKLICGLHKPNKQTVLPQDSVESLFATTPVSKVTSLGGKFGDSLTADLGVQTMGQLRACSKKQLTQKYAEKTANWLYNLARGIDPEPVTTKLISKSIACCKNFPGKTSLITTKDIQHWLGELSEELSERLDKDLKENNRKAKQLVLSFAQEINKEDVHSTRSLTLPSYESRKIMQKALETLNKHCLRSDGSYHVKFLGLSAGHFENKKSVKEITSFFKKRDIEQENTFSYEKVEIAPNNEDIYLQATQVIDQSLDGLVFYEDIYRDKLITENSIEFDESERLSPEICSRTSTSPASSFFRDYFNKPTLVEQDIDERLIDTSENNEETELCKECNTLVPTLEFLSHQDYHFALSLVEKEPTTNVHQAEKGTKRSATLSSFLQKETYDPDLMGTCSECNRQILIVDMEHHSDYHVAKKLHLEMNMVKPIKISPAKKGPKKSRTKKKTTSIAAFFKPL